MNAARELPGATADRADPAMMARRRRANVRTGLTLASIALVFFAGILAARFIGGPGDGVSLLGIAVLVFLIVAIGRNLWRGERP